MQSINILAVTPVFMTALFGTAVASLALAVWAVISWGERYAALVLAGGVLYLVGTIGVTMVCNVPLNNRLATVHPKAPTRRAIGMSMSRSGPHGTMCGPWRPSLLRPRSPSCSASRASGLG